MHVLDRIDTTQINELRAKHQFFWLDLVGADEQELRHLGALFGWHPIAVQDTVEFRQRPKLDRYSDHMLVVFYGAHAATWHNAGVIEVHLIVSGDWVVTVRRQSCDELDELRRRFQSGEIDERSEQFVIYRILDTLTDTFFPVLERIDDVIDNLEDTIVLRPSDEQLQRLFLLKRRLLALRRIITPQRDLAQRTISEIDELPGLSVDSRDYFRDVYDHLIRVSDLVDSYRDLLSSVMDIYLSTTSNRMNAVMKQLTLVATIFLPITALTGFFGQNFGWLTGHIDGLWQFLVFGVGGALFALVVLAIWFRRAKFFD